MMKKTMKKMAALTMAGMMAMSISTGTVSVLAAETDEVEGWEVVGTTSSCIPVSEYEGELDEYAPEDGYVLDVQFVNSDVKDYYVFPMFICDLTGDAYPGEHVAAVLLNTEAVYSPDAVVGSPTLLCQDAVRVEAGTPKNVRYYIDFKAEDYIAVCNTEYAIDDQTAGNNACRFDPEQGYYLGAASMQIKVYDADALDAQIAAAQQQGETEYQAAQQQEDSQYQQQYQEPQYQESGYTEEQEQQFNEFGSRVWEDAKESISESFSEGLDGFWSPETIAQGLELGKNLLLE
mgnify:FL=1